MGRIVDASAFDPEARPSASRIVSEDAFDAPMPKGNKWLELARMIAAPKAAAGAMIDRPEAIQAGLEGFRGRSIETQDPMAEAANMYGRFAPPIATTMLMPSAGAANLGGIAAARYLPQAGKIGFHGLRALAGGADAAIKAGAASGGMAALAGAPPMEALETGLDTGEAFGKGEAAVTLGIPAVAKGWGIARRVGRAALEKAGDIYSGIRPASFETLRRIPEKVREYARKGMTTNALDQPIPVAQVEAQAIGRRAQESIGKAAEGAGESYGKMMEYLHSAPENAQKLNVGDHVAREMEPIIEKQFGSWLDPEAGELALRSKKVFDSFYRRARAMHDTHPGKVANLMQEITEQITEQIKAKRYFQLSAALGKLKQSLIDALPNEYSYGSTADRPWGVGEEAMGYNIKAERQGYRAAKQLQRELAPYASKDDPVLVLEGAMRRGGKTSIRLKRAAEVVPEIKTAIEEIPAARAGADFAPEVGKLPRTGLTGFAMDLARRAMKGDAAAIALLPLAGVGASPRALVEVLVRGRTAANAIERGARQVGESPSIPALVAAILKSRKKEKK